MIVMNEGEFMGEIWVWLACKRFDWIRCDLWFHKEIEVNRNSLIQDFGCGESQAMILSSLLPIPA